MANRLLGVTLLLLCVGCAVSVEDEEQLRTTSKAWEDAFNAGDAKALAAIYAPEAMLLPPNAEFVQGRESIEEFWAGFIEGVKGELEIQEVLVQGDLANLLGTYILDGDGKVVDRGKYVEIWKRGSGQWGLYRDIWNTSLPKSEPAAQ